ncbi:hypothetical protein ACFXO9_26800 [Nocardia tengchongensis]|uniref:hypothetical protein n=1 Tax=Nocardia tengchongensis TaxID=2055889 RepID=UPI0036BF2FD4
MSGGDPVEEGGQAVRTGFVQAMQTAAMTMNLLQRRGAESRSAAEFERRGDEADIRLQQNREVHDLKVTGYHSRATHETELHALETDFKARQIERAEELHVLERRIKERIIERGDADLDRRAADSAAERANKDELHELQRQNLLNRGASEEQRHDLDVAYKTLLIEIRRRAAGFTETLNTQDSDHAAGLRSAAAYAAARSTADLSDMHRSHAEAFDERLIEDAGTNASDLLDTDPDGLGGSAMTPAVLRATRGLTDELNFYIVVDHAAQPDTTVLADELVNASVIDTAIELADVLDVEVVEEPVADPDPFMQPEATATPPAVPERGIEP